MIKCILPSVGKQLANYRYSGFSGKHVEEKQWLKSTCNRLPGCIRNITSCENYHKELLVLTCVGGEFQIDFKWFLPNLDNYLNPRRTQIKVFFGGSTNKCNIHLSQGDSNTVNLQLHSFFSFLVKIAVSSRDFT